MSAKLQWVLVFWFLHFNFYDCEWAMPLYFRNLRVLSKIKSSNDKWILQCVISFACCFYKIWIGSVSVRAWLLIIPDDVVREAAWMPEGRGPGQKKCNKKGKVAPRTKGLLEVRLYSPGPCWRMWIEYLYSEWLEYICFPFAWIKRAIYLYYILYKGSAYIYTFVIPKGIECIEKVW